MDQPQFPKMRMKHGAITAGHKAHDQLLHGDEKGVRDFATNQYAVPKLGDER